MAITLSVVTRERMQLICDDPFDIINKSEFLFTGSGSELSPIMTISSTEVTVSGIRCRAGSRCRVYNLVLISILIQYTIFNHFSKIFSLTAIWATGIAR